MYRLMEEYRDQTSLDDKEIARFQLAMVGWALSGNQGDPADDAASPLPIATEQPAEPEKRRALRLLAMVSELHKAGYQRLRIVPGLSPSGSYWRCSLTDSDKVRANGWEPIDWEAGIVVYSSADGDEYFGWKDGPGKTARQLAVLFVERFPEIAKRSIGRDHAYAGWFVSILANAEADKFPVLFADYDVRSNGTEPPPPPIYSGVVDLWAKNPANHDQ